MDAGFGPRRTGTSALEADPQSGRRDVRRLKLSALPGQAISLPSGFRVTTTDFAGAGVDLVLAGSAGAHFVVRNYFGAEPVATPSESAFAAIDAMLAQRSVAPVRANGHRSHVPYPYRVGASTKAGMPKLDAPAAHGANGYDLFLFDINNAIWQDRIDMAGEAAKVRYLYRSKKASENSATHKRILTAGARYDFVVSNGAPDDPTGIKEVLLWRNFSTFLISRNSLTIRTALLVIRPDGLSILVDEDDAHARQRATAGR